MVTLLLIEDDKDNRENTAELLGLEGYEVVTATNGIEGFEKIPVFLPEVIICDVRMPLMDGFDLLSKLKHHPKYQIIPLIFLTAKSEKGDARRGLDLGAEDYIVKPFEFDKLSESIKRCLRSRVY